MAALPSTLLQNLKWITAVEFSPDYTDCQSKQYPIHLDESLSGPTLKRPGAECVRQDQRHGELAV
jgi:hypothetical protein